MSISQAAATVVILQTNNLIKSTKSYSFEILCSSPKTMPILTEHRRQTRHRRHSNSSWLKLSTNSLSFDDVSRNWACFCNRSMLKTESVNNFTVSSLISFTFSMYEFNSLTNNAISKLNFLICNKIAKKVRCGYCKL